MTYTIYIKKPILNEINEYLDNTITKDINKKITGCTRGTGHYKKGNYEIPYENILFVIEE